MLTGNDPALTDELRAQYAGRQLWARYRVTADGDGTARGVEVVEGVAGLDPLIMARLKESRWNERSQVVGLRVAVPWPVDDVTTEVAPPSGVSLPRVTLPDVVKIENRGKQLVGVYKLCVNRVGR